ncbi:hypothetical protein [Siphonobacter sp. SORGH_AS_1065]|uniref:hypothetical protein n=1 Tax=Siphonobacter sp. SORGH_AS_1065 TaxID=3041795 RepID=UPI0027814221|nr:hypothetical protein [Siphonobacter sp. SORGH_AS_1065]MDQ1085738.1 hypothetical protein [Siphonobacter sp. SORGH_AS_1065]
MVIKEITYGGLSREHLFDRLKGYPIFLNEFAEMLLFSPHFCPSPQQQSLSVAEITVGELGLQQGGTLEEIRNQARLLGLVACPLEAAFYSRFYFTDQEEVSKEVVNQNPPGALVIYSKPLSADRSFPRGLYLRKIKGDLWLRGYRCSDDYVWSPLDTFLFQVNASSRTLE